MRAILTRLGFVSVILLCLLATGCSGLLQSKTPNKVPPSPTPGEYFPFTENSYWEYEGEGNEFASFTREVIFIKDNRAQIRENNGGTISTSVFETTDEAVTRVFFQGEAYNDVNLIEQEANDNTIILKAPLAVSTKWGKPESGLREIIDVNASVDTPAGTFDGCIKVKITGDNSTLYEYFKSGIGMVKREFVSGEDRVTSSLSKYEIK
jgi:hypothetical protein